VAAAAGLFGLLLVAHCSEAFTIVGVSPARPLPLSQSASLTTKTTTTRRVGAPSWLSGGGAVATIASSSSRLQLATEEEGSTGKAQEDVVNEEKEDPSAAATEEEEEENDDNEEEEEQEDPDLKALKEEIAALESELKTARRKAADVGDRADDFTEAGYARKVAEMENMRRARSVRSFVRSFVLIAGWQAWWKFEKITILSVLNSI